MDKSERYERPLKYLYTEHAERNAIYFAARQILEGSTIYLQWFPCADCARAIIQSGIAKIVIDADNYGYDIQNKKEGNKRWEDSFIAAKQMLGEAGVRIEFKGKKENVNKCYNELKGIIK